MRGLSIEARNGTMTVEPNVPYSRVLGNKEQILTIINGIMCEVTPSEACLDSIQDWICNLCGDQRAFETQTFVADLYANLGFDNYTIYCLGYFKQSDRLRDILNEYANRLGITTDCGHEFKLKYRSTLMKGARRYRDPKPPYHTPSGIVG